MGPPAPLETKDRHDRPRRALEQLLRQIVADQVSGEVSLQLYCSKGGIRDVRVRITKEVPVE